MDKQKIQLLLRKHGKTPAMVARDLGILPSTVCRTIANDRSGSSRRVRLHISKIIGLKPSDIFNLEPKDRFFEDHLFCTDLTDSVGGV